MENKLESQIETEQTREGLELVEKAKKVMQEGGSELMFKMHIRMLEANYFFRRRANPRPSNFPY